MPGSITLETLNLPGGGRRDVLIFHDDNGPAQLLDVSIVSSNILQAEAATPSDTVNVPSVLSAARAAAHFIYIGAAGDVALYDGTSTLVFQALAVGVWHPMAPFVRVMLTGTTVTAGSIRVGY